MGKLEATSLKVLYVIDSLGRAGAEQSLAALAPRYLSLGIGLEIAVLYDRHGFREEVLAEGVPVLIAPQSGAFSQILWLRSVIRQFRPDLVHTTLFQSDIVGRLAAESTRVPVVSSLVNTAYGRDQIGELGIRRSRLAAAWALDAATAKLTSRMHAISAHVADTMASRLYYSRERIDIVPRGRDRKVLGEPSPERRHQVRQTLGLAMDEFVILSVARHEPQKSLETFVRACAGLAEGNWTALVAGRPGNQTTSLISLREDLHLTDRLRFLGIRDDVPDLLVAADVMVLPSRREGLGGAVLEAMAMQCPVIVSDLPVFDEVVDRSAALRFPRGDSGALKNAIVAVRNDPGAAAKRAVSARVAFDQRFTIDAVSQGMLEFYERALN